MFLCFSLNNCLCKDFICSIRFVEICPIVNPYKPWFLAVEWLENESWNLLVWMNRHGNNLYDSKQAFFMLSICSVVLLIDRISLVRLVSRFLCHHQAAPIRVLPFWYFWEIFPLSSNQSHCVIDLLRHVVQYRKGLLVRPFVCPILHSNFLK